MYSKLPNWVIGFHGCDISTYNDVLHSHNPLKFSNNDYDWLGFGIYFWENNLERAFKWAKDSVKRKNINDPAVIGAVIDLGLCLNLLDSQYIDMLKAQYEIFENEMFWDGNPLPQNINAGNSTDVLIRKLDCAVINNFHNERKKRRQPAFDSVRGVFLEGKQIYAGAGFREKTHIQIAILNPNCIKGYFAPATINNDYQII